MEPLAIWLHPPHSPGRNHLHQYADATIGGRRLPKPVRRALEWAVTGFIVLLSLYASSTGPSQSNTPPAQLYLSLPDDISTFRCPVGYSDPEFAGGGIVCRRDSDVDDTPASFPGAQKRSYEEQTSIR